jgi:hypothetical protein
MLGTASETCKSVIVPVFCGHFYMYNSQRSQCVSCGAKLNTTYPSVMHTISKQTPLFPHLQPCFHYLDEYGGIPRKLLFSAISYMYISVSFWETVCRNIPRFHCVVIEACVTLILGNVNNDTSQ